MVHRCIVIHKRIDLCNAFMYERSVNQWNLVMVNNEIENISVYLSSLVWKKFYPKNFSSAITSPWHILEYRDWLSVFNLVAPLPIERESTCFPAKQICALIRPLVTCVNSTVWRNITGKMRKKIITIWIERVLRILLYLYQEYWIVNREYMTETFFINDLYPQFFLKR